MGTVVALWLTGFLLKLIILPGSTQSLHRRSIPSLNSSVCTGCQAPVITTNLLNETTEEGKKSVLKCMVTGSPLPDITWYKGSISLHNTQKGRIAIKRLDWGSRLKFKTLQVSDTGRYFCQAKNKAGVGVSNTAHIIVRPRDGSCFNGSGEHYRGRINITENGYTCQQWNSTAAYPELQGGHNFCRNPGGQKNHPWCFTTDPNKRYDYCSIPRCEEAKSHSSTTAATTELHVGHEDFTYPAPTAHPGYCVRYTGNKCSSYINLLKTVYIKAVNQQSSIEKKLEIALNAISSSKKLSDKCKPYVLPLLCHYLFPYCDDVATDPKPRPICYEECDLLRKDICRDEYIVAKRESLEHVLFPDCSLLPLKESKEGKNCIPLRLPFTRGVRFREQKGDRCFNGTGEHYQGNVSVTEKGYSCQRWNSTEPHFHLMSPAVHHELRGGHNFCRNPGGKKDRPWCFTTNPKKRYDYCAIARCEEVPTIHVVSILYTVIPCLIIAIVFSSVVIIVCWRCHKQIIYNANQTSTPLMPVTVKTVSKMQEMKESLRLLKELGEGEFGKIYHGEISTQQDNKLVVTQVLISVLRKSHDQTQRQEFLDGKETWLKFAHPNVLPILSILDQGQPLYILYEYLECGTLHEYLIRHAPIDDALEDSEDDSATLWCYDLLSIAYQIAAGMNYLSDIDYVHGDLATRNCVIGSRFEVKITDLAATRSGYAHDYYRLPNRHPLPVRWMAPESIISYRFTTESDIWSFGVVLWELFSYGAQPYYGLSNEDVMHRFREFVLLPCPLDCPTSVYSLMNDCWNILPPSRPRFSSIYKILCALRCESTFPTLPT
ncbi:inactive tyrosine-protein kinase transmembrane receptor ROR1-like isoform X2 [Actinia tenebrosa]|uniref:Inactive tyrosine-protein kinase transmembrane receptor ROR1-like isoform X2 n=1 Tax=Actinia tenebrosa TaxID=6105 RepID=A0A6P8HTX8_ACTTE|nr:inactive tyrosine-protein kinase transmembrane receptor ROR1-like isoform X2 [Actinia tenebrosa]